MTDSNGLLQRAPASRTLTPALLAIGVAWALVLLHQLMILILGLVWIIDDGLDSLGRSLVRFGDQAIVEPLLFFLGAGALLVFVLPILPETKPATVLLRVAAASLGGLVVLSVKGLIEVVGDAVRFGFEFAPFDNIWIGAPLVKWFELGTLLVIGGVVAWILVNRGTARAASGPTDSAGAGSATSAPAASVAPPSDAG